MGTKIKIKVLGKIKIKYNIIKLMNNFNKITLLIQTLTNNLSKTALKIKIMNINNKTILTLLTNNKIMEPRITKKFI